MSDSEVQLEFVGKLGEEFVERLRRGERPSVREYVDKYPEHQSEIEELFPALAMLEDLAPEGSASLAPDAQDSHQKTLEIEQLGGYRIVREIGRGGMGVVYEAEQISLGRHVALKVLSKELLRSPRQRSRFEREAKAAAKLHHTNIVPVFGVGDDASVSYYVMQFIQGLGLDVVVEELRRQARASSSSVMPKSHNSSSPGSDFSVGAVAQSLKTGIYWSPDASASQAEQAMADATVIAPEAKFDALPQSTATAASRSDGLLVSNSSVIMPGGSQGHTNHSGKRYTYWQSVAQIGVQVAEALQYAHTQGVLHRDIKPSNLLLDMRGTVWVTDFGLAKLDDEQGLTQTGDILGTLRYMAPETFKGQTDARSEVYSLGLTLYELLALRPAFDQLNRNGLIEQVLHSQIEPLGKLNGEIPADLQTIVHKAIDREPDRRYHTAQELADDLQRFINDEPIKARRVSLAERMARWSRHNKGLAAATATVAVLITILAVGSTIAAGYFQSVNSKLKLTVNSLTQTRNELRQSLEELKSTTTELTVTKDAAVKARGEAQKEAAENLRLAEEAQAARRESLTMLADMQTERGLLSVGQGDAATAALWFANAAGLTPHAPERQAANRLRARNCLNDALLPEALLHLPAGPLRRFEFQPAGHLVLSLNGPCLRIVDLRLEEPLQWSNSLNDVTDARWSPNGQQIMVATGEGLVQFLEPQSGMAVKRLQHPERVEVLQWWPDGRRVAVCGTRIQVWNVTDEPQLEYDWAHPQPIFNISISQSGTRLVAACEDDLARVYAIDRPASSALIATVEHHGHSLGRRRSAPVFCESDRTLVTLLKVRQPGWWNAETGERIPVPIPTNRHPYNFSHSLAVSADGQWVGVGGYSVCLLWNANGIVLLPHDHHVCNISFAPDGESILTTCFDGRMRLWEKPFGAKPPVWLPQMETVAECVHSSDGLRAALVSYGERALVWRTPQQESIVGHIKEWTEPEQRPRVSFDGRLVTPSSLHDTPSGGPIRPASLTVAVATSGQPAGPTIALPGPLADSCLCSDNKSVAAACVGPGDAGWIAIYDVATGTPVFPPIKLPSEPLTLAARPGHSQIAVLCHDGRLIVINSQDGSQILDVPQTSDPNEGGTYPTVEYTPDGSRLVALVHGYSIYVRDANTGELRFPVIGPQILGGMCRSFTISGDSRFLATGISHKHIVKVWNLANGKPEGVELPHSHDWYGIIPMQFSPDGKQILTGHRDGQMRLFDWRTGQIQCPPMQHADEVLDVKFASDGKHGLAAVRNGTVNVWDLATGKRAAAPMRYPAPIPSSTAAIAVSGSHVIASAAGYPVIDLSQLLNEPGMNDELLLRVAELTANRHLQLGELTRLDLQEWDQRWIKYSASRTSPQAATEELTRLFDEASDDRSRQVIANRADRAGLLERLVELRPDQPKLQNALLHALVRSGDKAAVERQRAKLILLLEKSKEHAALLAALKLDDQPSPWSTLSPVEMTSELGVTLKLQPDNSILTDRPPPGPDVYTVRSRSPLRRIAALRVDLPTDNSLPNHGPGWTSGNFHLTEVRVEVRRSDSTTVPITFRSAAADMIRSVLQGATIEDGPLGVIDGRDETHWDIWPHPGTSHWLALRFAEPVDVAADDLLIVKLEFHDPKYRLAKLGSFRLSVTSHEQAIDIEQLLSAVRDAALTGPEASAAMRLAANDAAGAIETLLSHPNSGPCLLLLARAHQAVGDTQNAKSTTDRLIEWLQTNLLQPRLQHILFEVLTEVGGLDRSQFYEVLAKPLRPRTN